jgi:RNA polymerase sigma-70 factor (ECF subfamily)
MMSAVNRQHARLHDLGHDGKTRSWSEGTYGRLTSSQIVLDKQGWAMRLVHTAMASTWDLERLYDEHAGALFAFLLNLTRNEADTRDCLQEIFVKLARNPAILAKVRNEQAFLLRLAHNQAVDHIRRRDARNRHHQALAQETADLFAETHDPDEAQFRRELARALEQLPPEQRAVVHLKLWEDLTFEQIAETLEIPLNTAASRYRYGLDKLRSRLRPIYEDLK